MVVPDLLMELVLNIRLNPKNTNMRNITASVNLLSRRTAMLLFNG